MTDRLHETPIDPCGQRSDRSTSIVKSTWPGVSMMLIRYLFQNAALAAPLVHDRLEHCNDASCRQRAAEGTKGDRFQRDSPAIREPHRDMAFTDDVLAVARAGRAAGCREIGRAHV